MAIKIKFDVARTPEFPTLVLARRDGSKIGMLTPSEVNLRGCLNDADEIQFKIYKEADGVECPFWDDLVNFKLIWCKEWNAWFSITVELDETNPKQIVKDVNCVALGESELSQIMLYTIEINTEDDIARDDYKVATLYNGEDHEASLIHRITEKAPHYQLKHVDSTIANIQRTFTFDGTSIYDAFQEIAEEIGCLFMLDCYSDSNGNLQRTISIYDLETNCNACGHRGEFSYTCPECGSKDLNYGYGEDTTIFVSSDALGDEIQFETDTDSVKNCFRLEAGDDLMTASIVNCNPNGSGYIWYLPEYMRQDMSEELRAKLTAYDSLYEYYQKEYSPSISSSTLNSYNNLVNKYKTYNPELETIALPIKGYPALMNALYNTIDLALYLESALMPTYSMQDTTAAQEIVKLTRTNLSPVAVSSLDYVSQATADSAVLSMAKVLVDSRYKVEIKSSSVSGATWAGSFTVTNMSNEEDTATGSTITVELNDSLETFAKQKIDKTLAKGDDTNVGIVGLFKRDHSSFCSEIRKYSLHSLTEFYDACQACLNILIEQGIQNGETWSAGETNLYDNLYVPYYNKLTALEAEIQVRENEIAVITGTYDTYGDLKSKGLQNVLYEIRDQVQDALNFEKYLGEKLWHNFCAYRREDTYSNDNYISDGLDNSEIFKNGLEFIEVASKELYKAAELQHSISTTLRNMLVLKEFESIVDYFEVGNWLRIQVDEEVFRLRLLEYEIDYDDLSNISVTFSDVTKLKNGMSDMQSVIDQAKSMATSYDAVIHQANLGAKSNHILDNWVQKGLDATATKIMNSADNQDIVFDQHGMIFRKYDEIIDDYSPIQLKIINSTLAITDDNWKTVRTAIGNFLYQDPANGNQLTNGYGINAEVLVGRLIIGQELGIYNSNGTLKFDRNGFVVKNDMNQVKINPSDGSSLFSIQKIAGGKYNNLFYIDDNGNVHMSSGVIEWDDLNNPPQINNVVGLPGSLNNLDNKIDTFRSDVEDCLGTTKISSNSVISPYIGGGYLYIAKGGNSVTIDPTGIRGTNTLFEVCSGYDKVMGITSGGNGYFAGQIECDSGHIGGFIIGAGLIRSDNYRLTIEDSGYIRSSGNYGITDIIEGRIYLSNLNKVSCVTGSYSELYDLTVYDKCDIIGSLHVSQSTQLDNSLRVLGKTELLANTTIEGLFSVHGDAFSVKSGYVTSNLIYSYTSVSDEPNMRVTSTGSVCRTPSSSRRYKECISTDLSNWMNPEKLYDVDIVQFRYKSGYIKEQSPRVNDLVIGFIAEDIDEKYPAAANYNNDGLPESWNVKKIVPPMLALIQNHYKELNSHQSEIESLQNRLESMEYKLQQAFERISEYEKVLAV